MLHHVAHVHRMPGPSRVLNHMNFQQAQLSEVLHQVRMLLPECKQEAATTPSRSSSNNQASAAPRYTCLLAGSDQESALAWDLGGAARDNRLSADCAWKREKIRYGCV